MWSRNGTRVASLFLPLPSRFTETAIRVSVVFRLTVAFRMKGCRSPAPQLIPYRAPRGSGKRLRERLEQPIVLLRRADGQAQAMLEQRVAAMQILDQHAAGLEPFENPRGVGRSEE